MGGGGDAFTSDTLHGSHGLRIPYRGNKAGKSLYEYTFCFEAI